MPTGIGAELKEPRFVSPADEEDWEEPEPFSRLRDSLALIRGLLRRLRLQRLLPAQWAD